MEDEIEKHQAQIDALKEDIQSDVEIKERVAKRQKIIAEKSGKKPLVTTTYNANGTRAQSFSFYDAANGTATEIENVMKAAVEQAQKNKNFRKTLYE